MNLNKSTLSEQIYQILRSDILTQKIPLGEKLTLKSLQTRFEVSSTPIREALTRLAEEELVVSYSNIGVNVIDLKERDLRELYRFIGDMDALAIRYASEYGKQDELLCRLEENVGYTQLILNKKEALTKEEEKRWIEYSDHFHILFYDYCGNSRLVSAAARLRGQMTIFSNLYETSLEIQKEIEAHHIKIYEAYREGNTALAEERMRAHLAQSMQYAVQCLSK